MKYNFTNYHSYFLNAKGKGDTVKMMAVVFIVTEISYLVVDLFNNLVPPLSFSSCDFKFFGCAVSFNLAIARNGVCLRPYLRHTSHCNRYLLSYF